MPLLKVSSCRHVECPWDCHCDLPVRPMRHRSRTIREPVSPELAPVGELILANLTSSTSKGSDSNKPRQLWFSERDRRFHLPYTLNSITKAHLLPAGIPESAFTMSAGLFTGEPLTALMTSRCCSPANSAALCADISVMRAPPPSTCTTYSPNAGTGTAVVECGLCALCLRSERRYLPTLECCFDAMLCSESHR